MFLKGKFGSFIFGMFLTTTKLED